MAQLYFYYSAMNAGKTTSLLQAAYNYKEKNLNTLLLTPNINTREGTGIIKSRIGLSSPARSFKSNEELYHLVRKEHEKEELHCILIDESQFLTKKQVAQLCKIADNLNIPVLAYGLRTDFLGNLFEGSQYLLAWADKLKEIKSICHTGRKATMVLRLDNKGVPQTSGQQIEIGGNDKYTSVSRKEFSKYIDLEQDT